MNTIGIVLTIIALVIGFFIGTYSKKSELTMLLIEKNELKQKNEELSVQIQNLISQSTSDKTKLNMLEELQKLVKEDFTNIANQVIKEEQTDLRQQNRETLEEKLKPIKENFDKFKEKIEEFNKQGQSNTVEIKTQIETLLKESQSIQTTAENLSRAINTNSQVRGEFGEMILENLLRNSGLINKKDDTEKGNYITQTVFKDETAPNELPRPDAVVFFPDEKHIVIDSKCPLNNFLNYINSDDQQEKTTQLNLFYKSVLCMINDLSGKYNTLNGLNTPEFKLMFIPLESCAGYIYTNREITDKAMKQNIIIVCPSTLLATLKIINKTWVQKSQAENLGKIIKTATSAYDKLSLFIKNIEDIKLKFNSLEKSFDKFFTSARGKGGLIKQIECLRTLGIATQNKIDEKYLTDDIIEQKEIEDEEF